MTRLWARFLPLAGSLCLAGMGFILYRGGAGSGIPGPVGAALFLLLAILLPLSSILRGGRPDARSIRPARVFLLLASAGLLAAGIGFLLVGNRSAGSLTYPSDGAARLSVGKRSLERLAPALDGLGLRLAEEVTAETTPDSGREHGHLFRVLERAAGFWKQEYGNADEWNPAAVVWMGDERIAWTRSAVPLTPIPVYPTPGDIMEKHLVEGREGWYLRQLRSLPGDLVLELQVSLADPDSPPATLGLSLQIVLAPVTMATLDESGRQMADVVLDGVRSGAVRLTAQDPGSSVALIRWRARLLFAALAFWMMAGISFGRLSHGPTWVLGALWVGRALLAEVELLRWVTGLFPGTTFPAGPGSLISLVDPAYFATPFAFGWFASAADALVTTLLVAGTAWWLLARQGLVAGSGRSGDPSSGPSLWVRGLLFGASAGIMLIGLRFLAGLLAENANARLIGTGVSLSFLSFWGLHVSLMLASFSLASLVTGIGAGRMWQGRRRLSPWLAAAGLAGVTAGLVGILTGGLGWTGGLLAAGVVAGLWCAGATLQARPLFLRRFVWPTVILLTVIWNYGSLREIYDRAERSWLQRKGGLITQADQDWTRYLLGSVLEDMRDRENAIGPGPGPRENIWRNEPAWALWRDSALRDLGYSCLVELVDPDGIEESLFARGFMRDLHYEIADRSAWMGPDGLPLGEDFASEVIFQVERRVYAGGEEEILAAEIERLDWRGWIRVELPLRSWRISTQMESLGGMRDLTSNGYRPRAEIDRPVVLLLADESGWLAAGPQGFPGEEFTPRLEEMQAGHRDWVSMDLADGNWFCRWNPLPAGAARTPGEGFVLGLGQPGFWDDLLDLSRLMLLNLVLYFFLYGAGQVRQHLSGDGARISWAPGFQERFLSGYLLLGLVLLLVVGTSVDRAGYDRVRGEARSRTRAGMTLAVEQLRSLLVEQAASLAESEYIGDLLRGQLAGNRTVGPVETRQGMVFRADGTLLLDETLSDLDDESARALLAAGREAPMVVVKEDGIIYVGAVIPLDLGGFLTAPDSIAEGDLGHGDEAPGGFFFYRQILDGNLIGSLADLASGQATLRFEGKPVLASHPAPVFAGRAPLLADPGMMAVLFDHPAGMGVFASSDRPFAYTGTQPLPAFARNSEDRLVRLTAPAYLALEFPDREREHVVQRRGTVLFLAGLANLILLTAMSLAMLMSWSIFGPLRLLMTATRSLAQGDFDAPLPEAGRDEIGRLAAAFGLMRSELQSARSRLEARERFLTTVLDRVTVGVAVLDANGRTVTLNPTGLEILAEFYPGVGADEVLPRLVEEFGPETVEGPTLAAELRSSDGRRTLRGARAPLALPGGRTDTMLVFEDITEFLTTKKMALNAELARQVAHEIKNPLTPIQLSVQLLDQARRDGHPDLDRILADTVTRVLDQVTLLRSIAGEFSLLGRPGELSTEAVDLAALVTEVAAGYGAGPKGAQPLGTEPISTVPTVTIDQDHVPPVKAHRESLLKILGNLMQNSLDAGGEGRPVGVEVHWRIDPDSVTMFWTDDGSGLPAEVADRLFDPYFSTKSKGTGLGLAICRNLADRMGGAITLANRDDGPGARAELRLPRADLKEID